MMKQPNTQANKLQDEMLNILLKMPIIADAINDKEQKSEHEELNLRLELIDLITAIDEKIPTLELEIKKLEEKANISFSKWEKDKSELLLQHQASCELIRSRSALWKSLNKDGECLQSALSIRLQLIIRSERQRLNSLESEYSRIPKDFIGKVIEKVNPERVKKINSFIGACHANLKKLEEIAKEVSALSMARISPSKLKAEVNRLSEVIEATTGKTGWVS